MLKLITDISMYEQISYLIGVLFLLLIIKFVHKGFKKPNHQDFLCSIIICLSAYSCWAILKVTTIVEESNDVVIPMFLALAMQMWMTFNSITEFLESNKDDQ